MRTPTVRAIAMAVLLVSPAIAYSQTRTPPAPARPAPRPAKPRKEIRISVNGGVETLTSTTSETATPTINAEPAQIQTAFSLGTSPLIDAGGLIKLTPRFGVGGSVSFLARHPEGELTGEIPHPFFFNRPRDISGTIPNLDGTETGIHVELRVYVRELKFADVSITGGPSFFVVKQELVTDVDYQATYPYDTATFTGAFTESQSATQVGYNIGADIVRRLNKKTGLGALVRYSGASVDLQLGSGTTTVRAGGLQLGGGLRITF
jgi:hypothetical protein